MAKAQTLGSANAPVIRKDVMPVALEDVMRHCTPGKPNRRFDVNEIDELEHWIECPRGKLFAKSWTPRTLVPTYALILFHDSLGCVALWRDFPKILASATGRRVIAYDRLGFGRSDARSDILQKDFIRTEALQFVPLLCDALSIPEFVACGHSVGGGMAVETGAAFPQRCRGVVTIAAQAFVEDRTLEGIRNARLEFASDDYMARLARYHGDKAEWVLRAWIETWLDPTFADWTLAPALRRLECPVLAIHGEQDEYGSTLHASRISDGRGERRILPDAGHNPHREGPDALAGEIANWLPVE